MEYTTELIFQMAMQLNLHIVTATSNDGIIFYRVFKQKTTNYKNPGNIGTFRGDNEVIAFLQGYGKAELVLA